MADQSDQLIVSQTGATTIDLYPARPFKMYTIIEHELASLETATDEETIASGFFWGSFGLFGGGVLGWLGIGKLSAEAAAAYGGIMTVLGFAVLWFGVKWFRARRARKTLSAAIRSGDGAPTRLQIVAR